jgi:hypothetical protein
MTPRLRRALWQMSMLNTKNMLVVETEVGACKAVS